MWNECRLSTGKCALFIQHRARHGVSFIARYLATTWRHYSWGASEASLRRSETVARMLTTTNAAKSI